MTYLPVPLRTVRKAPQGLQSTASENTDAEITSDAPVVRGNDSRVQALALAFTGQDILKSIMREHQTDSFVTAEIQAASAGDNLLIQDQTKTALALIAVRLHVTVTTDGTASVSDVSRASVSRRTWNNS